MKLSKVVIIGGGCAGLTAALYCARAELEPLVFVGDVDQGGLLVKTSVVENYPGFADGILGFDLVSQFQQQAEKYGAVIKQRSIVSVDLSADPKVLIDDRGDNYFASTVIIATGSKPNKLGLPHEDKYWGNGISSCATCDGALFKRKKIIVVGGGDSAMEEANFLTKFSDVLLIHRGDSFRASKAMQHKVLNNPRIKIMFNTKITELIGDTGESESNLTSVRVMTGTTEQVLPVDGLFYGLGLKPNSQLFVGQLLTDQDGYIVAVKGTERETETSVNGVFVCGDVHDKTYRQAVVACGDGCKAALDVVNWLS